MIANPRLCNYHSIRYKSKKLAARTNEYAKEKNIMFSAKFHAVLLKCNRDYSLSNTLIYQYTKGFVVSQGFFTKE